jgi:hypothetical protein
VSGIKPAKIELSATVRRISRELPLDMVLSYASIDDVGSTVAHVSKHTGTIEILQSADDEAAFVSDMTNFIPPPNCLFHQIVMDAGRSVVWKWAKMIELHRAMAFNGSIKYRFNFA